MQRYNVGVPAGFKVYIDNIVRVGRTFGFDRSRQGLPNWPMLTGMGKRMVVLGSRGDYGYEPVMTDPSWPVTLIAYMGRPCRR
ncbi:NAD(P)H-dependent oxidoreductase [Franzmannia pantelleriensis]|uniref:NAD(P)H-dependent oxidoreductase n=1 Tax=Franzmannia pantelleriensis TaxID=48727 RepID=UPI001C4098F2